MKYFSWESHHSIVNEAGSATVLSKEIALNLNLVGKPQSFELFTHDNKLLIIYLTTVVVLKIDCFT